MLALHIVYKCFCFYISKKYKAFRFRFCFHIFTLVSRGKYQTFGGKYQKRFG